MYALFFILSSNCVLIRSHMDLSEVSLVYCHFIHALHFCFIKSSNLIGYIILRFPVTGCFRCFRSLAILLVICSTALSISINVLSLTESVIVWSRLVQMRFQKVFLSIYIIFRCFFILCEFSVKRTGRWSEVNSTSSRIFM